MDSAAESLRPRTRRAGGDLAAAALLVALGGCATDVSGPRLTAQDLPEIGRFYWPYAALAADIYRTGGEGDMNTAMAMALAARQAQAGGQPEGGRRVLPTRVSVPARQWLRVHHVRLPTPLRLLLAAQPKLVTPALQVGHRVITRHLRGPTGLKAEEADSGEVTLIQPGLWMKA